MPLDNRPQGRKKNVTEGGTGVHKHGNALGGGPVGSPGSYQGRPSGGSSRPGSTPGESSRASSGGNRRRKVGSSILGGAGIPTFGGGHINNTSHSGGSSGGRRGGGLIRIILILAVLFIISRFLGCGQKGTQTPSNQPSSGQSTSAVQNQQTSSNTASQGYGTASSSQGSGALSSLLGLLGSSQNNAAVNTSGTYTGWSAGNGSIGSLNTTVPSGIRSKFTSLVGGGQDKVNIMVYLCGTDLESRSRMATSDLIEMASANVTSGSNINLLVYTGGCKQWQTSGISNRTNQIYQLRDGGIDLLVEDDGDKAMTDPDTLLHFLTYCRDNFSANRNILIFWDHGGGSVTGYGYDERHSRTGSMDLTEIRSAIAGSGMTFDIIGFDACLMATTEVAISLAPFADYLLASEETEPGTGWYYTNWLNLLSDNTSVPTVELGKKIIDDFVDVSAVSARGQSTTLSLVDLAELSYTFPAEFTVFARDTTALIENNQYKAVSDARSSSREFARSSKIDQVDLVSLALHLAKTTNSDIGAKLASSVVNAVKYNRTSRDMTDSYGLSIYCPKDKLSQVNTMVNTYQTLGLDEEYADCIKKLATIQASGQAVTGGTNSPFAALFGGSSYGQSSYGSSSYDSLFGSTGASLMTDIITQLLSGRSLDTIGLNEENARFLSESGLSAETIASALAPDLFDARNLYWNYQDGAYTLHLPEEQWDLVHDLKMNVFYDDGEGYVDLGMDSLVEYTEEGDLLVTDDRTWMSINSQPVAYYALSSVYLDDGTSVFIGRVPCLLNGSRSNLLVVIEGDEPGYVAGAVSDYVEGETDTVAKSMTQIADGDTIEFLCDYYSYDNVYQNSYRLGTPIVVDGDLVVSDTVIDAAHPEYARVSYRFTDIYGQNYWTPAI